MPLVPPPARLLPLLLPLLLLLGGCLEDRSSAVIPRDTPPGPAVDSSPDYWPTTAWLTATPESQGFLPGAFATLAADAATALPYHTSLMVIRNGWILHESYHDTATRSGVSADTRHHVWSITKSVTALTIGRALTLGDLQWSQLEATVGDTLPAAAWNGLAADDPRLGIRLIDTLRMRSGLGWNEATSLLQAGKDPLLRTMYGLEPNCPSGPEQVLCGILQQPLAYTPGEVWNYSTYDTYLASGLFTHLAADSVADKRLAAYADTHLFGALGIDPAATDWWNLPSAYTFGGGLLHITSRDLAKVGLLTLYGGKWDGSQLIDPAWMAAAVAAQGSGQVATFDGSGLPAGTTTTDIPYGLQWWRTTWPGFAGSPSITARGLGGQLLHLFPEQELVIIITCDDASTYDRAAEINDFLATHILAKLAP